MKKFFLEVLITYVTDLALYYNKKVKIDAISGFSKFQF